MECVEGCGLTNYNDIMETDHRACMIGMNAENYFKEELTGGIK